MLDVATWKWCGQSSGTDRWHIRKVVRLDTVKCTLALRRWQFVPQAVKVVSAAQGVTDGVLQLHLHPLDADARPLLFTRANKITFGKVQASLKNRRVRWGNPLIASGA